MTEQVPNSLREVWEWRRADDQATRGKSREELIAYYDAAAQQALDKLGLRLESIPASRAARLDSMPPRAAD